MKAAYQEYKKCQAELKSLDMDEEQKNREMAFLEFEINEIEKASLVPGEDEELEKQYRKLSNGRRIIDSLQSAHALTGYDGQGAGEAVGEALRELSRVTEYDEQLESLSQTLSEVDRQLNDFNREQSYMDDMTFDESVFYETERRLDLLNGLKAKYGQRIEEIQEYQKKQQEKLNKLQKYEEIFEAAKEELKKAEKKLETACSRLSEIRKEYSHQLEEKVIQGLKDLNFLDVQFAITFSRRSSFTENGYDEIQYEISTNPGESLKPLGKIVSGGELSRIMLAIKAILADKDQIDTLIFDEIDTGISGRTAWKVAEQLSILAGAHQVICITHLPQIAAMADVHFIIEKSSTDDMTITDIHKVAEEESLAELARLLGSDALTESALSNAKEMKEQANGFKEAR